MRYATLTAALLLCGCEACTAPLYPEELLPQQETPTTNAARPGASEPRVISDTEAMLINTAREVAVAQGFRLQDRIYSVRRTGAGWTVTADLSPGFTGEGPTFRAGDASFWVDIDANGRATRIYSHAGETLLAE